MKVGIDNGKLKEDIVANSGLGERVFRFKGNQPFPVKRERISGIDFWFSASRGITLRGYF